MMKDFLNPCRMGVGVDIERVDRFEKFENLGPAHIIKEKIRDKKKTSKEWCKKRYEKGFLARVFTPYELKYCFSKTRPAQHLAARFAAKEAVMKALACLIKKPCAYNAIEIFNNAKGVPKIRLKNDLMDFSERFTIMCSLSHCNDRALAFVIVIKKEE